MELSTLLTWPDLLGRAASALVVGHDPNVVLALGAVEPGVLVRQPLPGLAQEVGRAEGSCA